MEEYKVVEAKKVASNPDGLAEWLNEQTVTGWHLVTVDNGVIYLSRGDWG